MRNGFPPALDDAIHEFNAFAPGKVIFELEFTGITV